MKKLSENAHLLRYPYPSSLRRTSTYASFLGISEALHLDIFHQLLRSGFSTVSKKDFITVPRSIVKCLPKPALEGDGKPVFRQSLGVKGVEVDIALGRFRPLGIF